MDPLKSRTRRMREPWEQERYKPDLPLAPEMKKQYTDKKFLIAEQKRLTKLLQLEPHKYQFKSPAESCYPRYYPVDILPHNRVDLDDLIKVPNEVIKGKLFLCRTITPSIKMCSLLTVVEVPDTDMKDRGVLLSLHNYLHPLDEEEDITVPILSPGTVLVLKNPMFYQSSTDPGYFLRCDNPADVILPDDKQLRVLYPGLKWPSGEFENEENRLIVRKLLWGKTKDWKSIGHYRLEKKNYVAALEAYTLALQSNPRDIEALIHRCALHLRLKVYQKSLHDSEEILNKHPFHEVAISHKVSSLIGLSHYSAAIQFLKWHIKKGTTSADPLQRVKLMELLMKAKEYRKQQKHGTYDLVTMLQCSARCFHDCADYIGSITECYIDGKGRGIIATEDIKCGDLIVAAKALEMAFPDNDGDLAIQQITDIETGEYQIRTQAKLVVATTHRVMQDPGVGKVLYNLHDGIKRSASECTHDEAEDECVNMRRIDTICCFNAFSGESDYTGSDQPKDDTAIGLWPSASLFNHTCLEPNSQWRVCGNVLFVRACRDILKDEEITLPYLCCTTAYSDRLYSFSRYGFVCNCRLCLLDQQEPISIHNRRREILEELNTIVADSDAEFNHIETLIEELWNQRPDSREINVYLLNPLMMLSHAYMKKSNYLFAAEILLVVYNIASRAVVTEVTLQCCLDRMKCYLLCNDIEKAKLCAIDLKAVLIQIFGEYSTGLLKYVSNDVAQAMTEHDIVL